MQLKLLILLFSVFIIASGCNTKNYEQTGSPEYIAEIEQWHQDRIERLKDKNSWLTLVGLYWLKEGENTFGSDKNNDIIFPENSPEKIGKVILIDSVITLKVNEGVNVLNEGNPINEIKPEHDLTGNPTILDLGSLRWYIIKRGEKYGIRLRDTEASLLKEFKGIETFPINKDWKISAKFVPYDPPKDIIIPTILGTTEEDKSPGYLLFNAEGKEYKLDAIQSSNGFFIIFADETSGEETYGAGRFLYTDEPDSLNNVILDFNKAYNPPCVFTKYATCPLPPKQNYLHLKITAGEMMWGDLH